MSSFFKKVPTPIERLNNVQLQWYINYDFFEGFKNLIINQEKYNRESGVSLESLVSEISNNPETLTGLCGDTGLEDTLGNINNQEKFCLVCRNMDDNRILGFVFPSISHQVLRNEYGIFSCYSMDILIFCGHSDFTGVGKKLMNALKVFCAEHNVEKIVLSPMKNSVGFYKSQGFYFCGKDMCFDVADMSYLPENRVHVNTIPNLLFQVVETPELLAEVSKNLTFPDIKCTFLPNKNNLAFFVMTNEKRINVSLICRDKSTNEMLGILVCELIQRPLNNVINIVFFGVHRNILGVEEVLMEKLKEYCFVQEISTIVLSRSELTEPVVSEFFTANGFDKTAFHGYLIWKLEVNGRENINVNAMVQNDETRDSPNKRKRGGTKKRNYQTKKKSNTCRKRKGSRLRRTR